jgi:hypothetical protein
MSERTFELSPTPMSSTREPRLRSRKEGVSQGQDVSPRARILDVPRPLVVSRQPPLRRARA